MTTPVMPAEAPIHQTTHQEDDDDGIDSHGFTDRERAIISMVVDGLSNKESARLLNLREVTIKVQLTRIYKKLRAKNRAQAATIMAHTHVLA